jgi:RsiW-degrading membrane proteinase PrsW (M82 family)
MILVSCIVLVMLGFALYSAIREISLYRKALKGEVQFLISKSRLQRRLIVSGLLIIESALLVMGYFVLKLSPSQSLLFWVFALVLIFLVIFLAMRDFLQTRKDIDKIFLESAHAAIVTAAKAKQEAEKKS